MILKYLFHQYDDRKGPCFGSRFMTFLGNTFMGTLADKGLGHLRKDLQDSYYRTQADRRMPKNKSDRDQWQMQSIQVSQYREVEAKQVALATCLVVIAGSLLCVVLASPFNGSLQATVKNNAVSRWVDRTFTREKPATEPGTITYDECVALVQKIDSGQMTSAQIPNYEATNAECTRLQRERQQQTQ